MPQQRKNEESERLRGERDQIKFIGFESWQVVRFRKAEEGKTFHKLHVLGMNDDLAEEPWFLTSWWNFL